jgi:trehalose 6-phosphate phosphatase
MVSRLLARLAPALDGRIAVLSGRALDDVDRILEGRVACVAAVHGLVWRRPDGRVTQSPASPALAEARQAARTLAQRCDGVLLEDKGASIALHYRQAPQAKAAVLAATARIAAATGLVVQNGAMVSELRTAGPNKGDSLRAFMEGAPFAGFLPVMVGDDLTDEDGFKAAAAAGGYGVLVGPARATHAAYRLEAVAEVLPWLEEGLA